MSYESDIESGAFTPSDEALAVDKYIASTSPETHPDEYTFLGTLGYAYTGPMGMKSSRSEHTAWVNSGLGASRFGGSFADIYDDPDEDDTPVTTEPTPDPEEPVVTPPLTPTSPSTITAQGPSSGAFTGMTPRGLSYSRQEAPSMVSSAPKVDYIKLLRGLLTESLFKDYI